MTGTFLGALGSPWHWHAWHAGGGWPLVGLFMAGLWIVVLGLVFTALWRRRGLFSVGGFPGPGPGSRPPTGGPAGGTAPVDRSAPVGTPGEPLRASTEEREATVHALSDAMADGRLSSEEHSERVSAAYAARYRHELAALIADLPGARTPQPQEGAPGTTPPPLMTPPGRLGAPVVLLAVLAGFLLVHSWAWGFGPSWLLIGLGVWLVVRARRRGRMRRPW